MYWTVLGLKRYDIECNQNFRLWVYFGMLSPGIPGENFKNPENPRPRGILKTGEISNPNLHVHLAVTLSKLLR